MDDTLPPDFSARPPATVVSRAALWEQRYAELLQFQQEHGHTRVPEHPPGNPVLCHWRHKQRAAGRQGRLTPERQARLDALGFAWEEPEGAGGTVAQRAQRWEQRYRELVQFKQRTGHCRVASSSQELPALGRWVLAQRTARKLGRLSPDRVARLGALGFAWRLGVRGDGRERWERHFGELLAFKALTGHTRVPQGPPGNPVLTRWCQRQRKFRRAGQLSAERIARLDALGFAWEAPAGNRSRSPQNEDGWERRFQQLARFMQRTGHAFLAQDERPRPGLKDWVAHQRIAYREGTLRPDRQARLEALGFEWKPRRAPLWAPLWEQRFAELQAFQRTHGHTRVPHHQPRYKVLATWRLVQRAYRRRGQLSPERIARLDALGFDWGAQPAGVACADHLEERWRRELERLRAFQQRFGHCDVPRDWEKDRRLYEWIRTQRRAAQAGRLSPERRTELHRLGFPWA